MTRALPLLTLLLLTARLAVAAEPATHADIQQIDDALFQARTAVSLLRTGDFRLRGELTGELERAHTESAGLHARVTAGEPVDRAHVLAVRERIDAVRRRARGPESVTGLGLGPTAVAPLVSPDVRPLDVPPGTVGMARLLESVNLGTLRVGDRIEAVVAEEIRKGARVIAPVGSLLRGVAEAGPFQPALVFDQILVGFTTFRVRATLQSLTTTDTVRAGALVSLRIESAAAPGRGQ